MQLGNAELRDAAHEVEPKAHTDASGSRYMVHVWLCSTAYSQFKWVVFRWQSTTPRLAYSHGPTLNVPLHERCGERRSPKVQPSTRPGIEPGTSQLAVRDLTNCANLAHTADIYLQFAVVHTQEFFWLRLAIKFAATHFSRMSIKLTEGFGQQSW